MLCGRVTGVFRAHSAQTSGTDVTTPCVRDGRDRARPSFVKTGCFPYFSEGHPATAGSWPFFMQFLQEPLVDPDPQVRIIGDANGGLGTARPTGKSEVGRGAELDETPSSAIPTAPSGPTRPTESYRHSVVLAQNVGGSILLGKSTGSKN